MNKVVLLLVALLGLGTVGIVAHNANANCVEVYVDFGPLNGGANTSECIPLDGETNALEVLRLAGFVIEGTQQYGEAVACRVNSFPDAIMETCETMPPAEAYWAVLVKEHQIVPIPLGIAGAWGWAQTGINEVSLKPGDSIGLVFADNGEVRFP
jgi:hypothetical protein